MTGSQAHERSRGSGRKGVPDAAQPTRRPTTPSTKVNPPLRGLSDVRALWEGLADGTVDAIATDHAPHASVKKDVEFDQAAFGISGLETALSLVLGGVAGRMGRPGHRDPRTDHRTRAASSVFLSVTTTGSRSTSIRNGWSRRRRSVSMGKNTPLIGHKLRGRVVYAVVGGEARYEGGLRGATPVGSR